MQHMHLWLNILTVILGAGLIVHIQQGSRSKSPALRPLLIPVVLFNLLILIDSLSGYVHFSFFSSQSAFKTSAFISFISPLTALIFLLLTSASFSWLWSAMDRKPPSWLYWYFKINPALFILSYLTHKLFFNDAGPAWEAMLGAGLILCNLAVFMIVLTTLAIAGLNRSATARSRQTAKMAAFYALLLIVWMAGIIIPQPAAGIIDAILPLTVNAFLFFWIPGFIKTMVLNNGVCLEKNAIDAMCLAGGVSERQQEILELLLQGKSNREIAELLYIAPHTVKNHIYHAYKKLGLTNRMELVNLVLTHQG